MYVEELVAPGTVNTMPEATMHAFADHGELTADAVTGSYGAGAGRLAALAALGIDLDDVMPRSSGKACRSSTPPGWSCSTVSR